MSKMNNTIFQQLSIFCGTKSRDFAPGNFALSGGCISGSTFQFVNEFHFPLSLLSPFFLQQAAGLVRDDPGHVNTGLTAHRCARVGRVDQDSNLSPQMRPNAKIIAVKRSSSSSNNNNSTAFALRRSFSHKARKRRASFRQVP